jgi:hypothetical protein
MNELISDDKLSKALTYLAETDLPCAKAQSLFDGLEEQTKTIKGIVLLQLPSGMTIPEKEARVYTSDTYKDHREKVQNAQLDYLTMYNRRKTAALIVECWRTVSSNKRAGMIT